MILYKTNKNWFGDIRHLAKSWTMVRILRSVIAISVYATIVCLLIDYMNWGHLILVDASVFSLLGVILSILLVFRTNTAYDRWWEARKQWGALVNNTRNFAIYVHAMFPKEDGEVRRFFGKNIANFCIALVEHLREGTKIDQLIYLSDEERELYQSKGHVPNFIALQLFDRLAAAHRMGEINEGDYINIKAQHQSLLDILGACERIKKTPIPFSYAVYLKIFITIYGLFLPIVLASALHLWTVLIVALFFFALLGVELMGEEIEDPFGLDCNDLPTGSIAHTIKINIFEILEDRSVSRQEDSSDMYKKVF
ncbi:MAG: bestrophin family ion channel [Saprospiraceae bacterium]|mgnify:CR=1 FL=1